MSVSTFTKLCKDIEVVGANSVGHHDLFREMALGTLLKERFQIFIQQDHLYLKKLFPNYIIMADKEEDDKRKEQLTEYNADGPYYFELVTSYYKEFDFEEATQTETYTQNYIDLQSNAALKSSIGECLATIYPCWILWHEAGVEMAKVVQKDGNIYSRYVDSLKGDGTTSALNKFQDLINGYYDRAGTSEQQNMLKNYAMAVQCEVDLCDGVYRML